MAPLRIHSNKDLEQVRERVVVLVHFRQATTGMEVKVGVGYVFKEGLG